MFFVSRVGLKMSEIFEEDSKIFSDKHGYRIFITSMIKQNKKH